jgi:hypothetical protein
MKSNLNITYNIRKFFGYFTGSNNKSADLLQNASTALQENIGEPRYNPEKLAEMIYNQSTLKKPIFIPKKLPEEKELVWVDIGRLRGHLNNKFGTGPYEKERILVKEATTRNDNEGYIVKIIEEDITPFWKKSSKAIAPTK